MAIAVQGTLGELGRKPVTEFSGFDFNSFCTIGFEEFGANSEGLFLLNEGANDNNEDVHRIIETAEIDFGTSRDKRIRFLYLELFCEEPDTEIIITVSDRQNSYSDSIYCAQGMKKYRFPVSHEIQGTHLSFKVESMKVFRIDKITALVNRLSAGYTDMGAY